MKIVVNGREIEAEAQLTLVALIEQMGLGDAACAAEVNEALVPKREHGTTTLAEGDRVELVTLVGGG